MKCNIPKVSNRIKPIPIPCCKCGKVIRNLMPYEIFMFADKNYVESLKHEMCVDCVAVETRRR
jgi:hypothetical protein